MQKSIWIVLVIFLFAAIWSPTVAKADDIAYDVNWTDGPISFIGFVITDGTIGAFNPCVDFLDGGGAVTDATHNFVWTIPDSAVCSQTGPSAWSATATSILFNFDAPTSETTFAPPSGVPSLSFISDGEISVVDPNGDTVSVQGSGEFTYATPEPGTLTMLLVGTLGLALLVGVKRYRRNSRATVA